MSQAGYPMSIKRLGDALGPLVFPPPPLKFRTAGFPQYGFKRDIRATTFAELQARLIRGASPSPCPLSPRRACVLLGGSRSPEHSRPEALGSPAGYVVPPGLCLLRPHVPLSAPLSGLFSSSRRVSSRPITTGTAAERFPNLLCVSVLSCRLPYPGGPHGCSRLILRHAHWPSPSWYRLGIHGTTIADSQVESVTRLQSSLHGTAREIASPSSARTFTFELSPPESPLGGVEYNYAGNQPIPAAGLSPARHAALWAADQVHKMIKFCVMTGAGSEFSFRYRAGAG